ncbi:unnamed protein product [Cylindrotheca closterium]|uniref:SET domain-containing protein n=1 Tax=Cylindrotheca closterium TaxID=2856 RepID=A0AAD2FX17_9STRA|nr:unnamed protein product [Cylindrotheca closterium]
MMTAMSLAHRALVSFYLAILLPHAIGAVKGGQNTGEKRRTRRKTQNLNLHIDDHVINYAKQDEAVRNMVKWSIEQGGYIHPNVEIRRWDPSDPSSYFGAFVNGPVKEDELLIKIPGSIKIQLDDSYRSGTDLTYADVVCELAWTLKREYELGEDSNYAPYIEYIETQSKHQIPAMWTDVGKHLITKVQGDLSMMDFDTESISGIHMHDWIDDYFGGEFCLIDTESGEEMEEWYVAMATQRGYDYCLIPVYDMLNHHNGIVNSITRPSIYDKDGFGVYALQDLNAGEELLYSYHNCPDCKACPTCETSLDYWGTPEMIRDFGFVEPYPQRFYYKDRGPVYLKIDETPRGFAISNEGGEWPEIEWIESEIVRLERLYEQDIHPLRNVLPLHELETIVHYHESLLQLFMAYYEAHLAENHELDSEDNESESEDEESSDDEDDVLQKFVNAEKEEEAEDADEFSTEL